MQRLTLLNFMITGLICLAACQHDPVGQPGNPVDPVNPIDPTQPPTTGVGCDPDSVYFQNQILPILISNCTESGCHNAVDRQEGIVLESYQSMVNTVNHATRNDLHENKLMRAILESDLDDRMPPPPKSALPQAQIELLKTWLAQGGRNNACDENFGGCDVANVTFGGFIKPLIQAKCQGCHSGASPQGGIKLSTYAEIKTVASNGKLMAALTRTSNWMPKGGAKLDACNLQKIQAWVDAGAPEN